MSQATTWLKVLRLRAIARNFRWKVLNDRNDLLNMLKQAIVADPAPIGFGGFMYTFPDGSYMTIDANGYAVAKSPTASGTVLSKDNE